MTEVTSAACPDCGAAYELTDNYCRRCGMYLAAARPSTSLTAEHQARALEPVRAGLPVPVKRAATALAIGTALQIGVGLAGKYLAGQAAKGAVTSATKQAVARPRGREVANAVDQHPEPSEATAISETVLIRRVWVRRG
ncbi:MAG: hypothetical protein M0R74_05285 [Dehalococcoidia bacterium]|nr:hypothetical protein [Dehalococcoidia bacterium]